MSPSLPKQLHFWAFLQGIGHYPGGWRYRGATPRAVFDLAYYQRVGRLVERGRFDAIVFGDQLQGRGANGRTPTLLAAIGSATTHVGLVATVSTTYNEPAAVADKFATLDCLSQGRAGWNIVTTAHPASAWNFGQVALPEKSARYQRAEEFVQVAKALWQGAQLPGHGPNATIDHQGRWFSMRGALAPPRSPQGRPVLVQAGQSGDGRDFAAKTAEAIFCPAKTLDDGRAFRSDIRTRMPNFKRNPDDVKVMPGLSFVLAPTEAEAIAKDNELIELSSPSLCIEYLSESVGFDLTSLPPNGQIPLDVILAGSEFPAEDIRKQLEPAVKGGTSLVEFAKVYVRTPRGHHVFRGTPEQLADMMGHWLHQDACDGFTLQPAYMPGELEIFIDEVVPLLQRKGLLRRDYESTTLRGHLGLASA
jgi:alkanesulfonate monooxygenase SsuD/methylene tetrahydromethanopterin reductase-like flavin-dependent oxidoreductase (luciferase family)